MFYLLWLPPFSDTHLQVCKSYISTAKANSPASRKYATSLFLSYSLWFCKVANVALTKIKNSSKKTFREAREHLLYTFSESLINNEEFTLLFDLNTSKNRDFHHWKYHSLDLNVISENDAYGEFRFLKNDIRRMGTPLRLPNKIVYSFYNDPRINSFEALCNLFNRLAYPNRFRYDFTVLKNCFPADCWPNDE